MIFPCLSCRTITPCSKGAIICPWSVDKWMLRAVRLLVMHVTLKSDITRYCFFAVGGILNLPKTLNSSGILVKDGARWYNSPKQRRSAGCWGRPDQLVDTWFQAPRVIRRPSSTTTASVMAVSGSNCINRMSEISWNQLICSDHCSIISSWQVPAWPKDVKLQGCRCKRPILLLQSPGITFMGMNARDRFQMSWRNIQTWMDIATSVTMVARC